MSFGSSLICRLEALVSSRIFYYSTISKSKLNAVCDQKLVQLGMESEPRTNPEDREANEANEAIVARYHDHERVT